MKNWTKKLIDEGVNQIYTTPDEQKRLEEITAKYDRENNRSGKTAHAILWIPIFLLSLFFVPILLLPITLPLLGILAVMTRPKGATK